MPPILARVAAPPRGSTPLFPAARIVTSPLALAALLAVVTACDPGLDPMDDADSMSGFAPLPDGGDEPEAPEEPEVPLPSCPEGPAPSMNEQGILTHHPDQHWWLGSSTLVPVSVNYVVTEDGDSRGPLLEMWVEIRNDGPTECYLLPEVYVDGEEIIGLVTSDPFNDDFSSVTNECIGPGGIGVYGGVARGISEADLEASTSVSFDPSPNTFSQYTPATEPALADQSVMQSVGTVDDEGFVFTATLRPGRDIYNYKLAVYPKDAHGLVVDELLAFPNELDTLPAGSEWPIETREVPCSFDEYHAYQSWIEGSASGLTPEADEPRSEHSRQRRLQMDALRR